MVGKLFKYEAKYYLRLFIPFGIIVLASAFFVRILFAFDVDSIVYDIIYGSSQLLFGVSIFVCFGSVTVLSITRFYKNLYGSEGYLSFTLPVTASQHIWAKFLSAFTFYMAAALIAFAGFCIATAGEVFVEFMKAAGYLIAQIAKEGGFSSIMFIIELIILLITTSVFELMLFYTCISLGQTAKKNRVFMAFAYYFIYYAITQVIGTIIAAVVGVLAATEQIQAIAEYVLDNIDWIMHVAPCAAIVINLGIATAFFFVNRSVMMKKLNLE